MNDVPEQPKAPVLSLVEVREGRLAAPAATPDPQLIARLEEALAMARAGRLVAVGLFYGFRAEKPGESAYRIMVGCDNGYHVYMVGCAHNLLTRAQSMMDKIETHEGGTPL